MKKWLFNKTVIQFASAVFLIALLVVAPSASYADTEFKTYINARFGYSVEYPDIFIDSKEPDNGDGIVFEDADGEYNLTIWGGYNVLGQNGSSLLEMCLERVAHIVPGSEKSGAGFYSIEYSDDGGQDGVEHIFFEYGVINADMMAGFILKYPKESEVRFAEIKRVIQESLKIPESKEVNAGQFNINVFSLKNGRVYIDGAELECEVNEVPSDIDGTIRYWSAFGQSTSEAVQETGVWFFSSEGACLTFLPLDSEYGCQDIVFSPDGNRFLLVEGSGVRPDMTYVLFETMKMERKVEIAGVRGNIQWIDHLRFVLTRIDDIRDEGGVFNLAYGWRVSAVLYDDLASEIFVLKGSTNTQNYWFSGITEDGSSVTIREESVRSEADWADEDKIETREIIVEIPPAG